MSDLHLEFWKGNNDPFYSPYPYPILNLDWFYQPNDVLILAGDIAVGIEKLEQTLHHFSKLSRHVIYVFGNHEYYGGNIDNRYKRIKVASNVHVLNPGHVKIDDVTFVGATLWTDFHNDPLAENASQRGITDFYKIRTGAAWDQRMFNTKDCSQRFLNDYKYLLEAQKLPGKKVYVTHFLPSLECVSPYWRTNGGTLNKYFAANCDNLINQLEDTPYWFFGHTHDQINLKLNDTQFIANPFGYLNAEPNANNAFQQNLEFELT